MYFLIYSSYAVIDFTDDALKELLIQSREKNKRLGVTGMLYYFEKQFVQLIEGDESIIRELGQVISKDPRHNFFLILKQGSSEERFFSDWSMGFRSIDPKNFKDVQNFRDLNLLNTQDASPIIDLFRILASH